MPEICRFFGIVIKMFFDDHNPPHFHAEYEKYEALININTLSLISGKLPHRALGLVSRPWVGLHTSGWTQIIVERCQRIKTIKESSTSRIELH